MSQSHPVIKRTYLNPFSKSDYSMKGLPYLHTKSPNSGPVLWLTACAHGDELGGIIVIQEVFKKLSKQFLCKGELHAFPVMNPIGMEMATREVPFSQEDLNRSFPGNKQGTLANRIAHKIFHHILETQPDFVLDLHNDWIHSIPYVVLDAGLEHMKSEVYKSSLELAHQTGFVIVNETQPISGSLSYNLLKADTPTLTIELGESFVINEKNIHRGVQLVWNCLAFLGMVEEQGETFQMNLPQCFFGKQLHYIDTPFASCSGIIRFFCQPGQQIQKGQTLAKIFDPFGKQLEVLKAEKDGLLLGYCDSSFSFPGSSVVAMGCL